jgi:hypothetical protein
MSRRYPRTLVEAFGPYADGPICAPSNEFRDWDGVFIAVAVLALVALALSVYWGFL